MILPQRLQKGDTVGIIAPAGPPNQKQLKQSYSFFQELGLHVKLGKFTQSVYGYLAGTDEQRLIDFHEMVRDSTVKAIFFARGGYGTGRLIPNIDFQLIRNNPKIMWGYSDITYLHTAIRQQTGLVTFHGPMAASDVGDPTFDALSAQSFQQLFTPVKLHYTEAISPLHTYVSGKATGRLVGGNLSLLVGTLGTPYEIETKGNILLIEDIGEVPYQVDAMLNQLLLAGKLQEVAGIVVGDFAHSEGGKGPTLSLQDVFSHYFSTLSCPVMAGFRIGHCFPHFAIPLGTEAMLDTTKKELKICAGVQ
ncbi:LD-carboxypeptidase [Virgibacillus soli]|uniref:LD-carboxypeptidase n=1 Tax=Paracerasibacillus soli TaxID=480284 RepID=A0ABU5CSW9_9BACI|nr:LD-carboxypeptidase [Virgibacillus soli]MDY0409476.1 LD-carboxypeptidase [Virgibacillus soli]